MTALGPAGSLAGLGLTMLASTLGCCFHRLRTGGARPLCSVPDGKGSLNSTCRGPSLVTMVRRACSCKVYVRQAWQAHRQHRKP